MRIAAAILATSLLIPASASAWGFEAHKFIVDRMIELLPPQLKPLFEQRRAFVVERAIDPDLWRSVGWEAESPNHFVDLDNGAFGPYPFDGLPREYDAAVQKFGKAFIEQQGTLPWRAQEFYGRLQREFENLKKPDAGYALDNIVLYSAVLAHYAADGHVPLHAAANHDGQLTGQQGVHARWESELFERNRAKLTVAPVAIAPITQPRDFMFSVLLASNQAVAGVLAADKAAAEGREFYDDGYFDAFAKGALPTLEKRLNESIAAAAAMITGAWEQAGKPVIPAPSKRTPRKIKRPNQ
jgi:hypothetical protein